jgi:hypothetical protein
MTPQTTYTWREYAMGYAIDPTLLAPQAYFRWRDAAEVYDELHNLGYMRSVTEQVNRINQESADPIWKDLVL